MDIVETLSQPLSMSMFRNSGDLYAEMTLQRQLAADTITALRARCASLEAERDGLKASRDGYVKQNAARAEESDRWQERATRAEAMCADLAGALETIVERSENGELGTSKVQDMKRTALDALAAPAQPVEAQTQEKVVGGANMVPCHCTTIEQDESCPVGYPSMLCEDCDGKGHVPAVKLDGSELWEIVFGIATDAASDITDEQYQQIADAINSVFIDTPPPAQTQPAAADAYVAEKGFEHSGGIIEEAFEAGARWATAGFPPYGYVFGGCTFLRNGSPLVTDHIKNHSLPVFLQPAVAVGEVERLRGLIRWAHDTLYEINPSNYDHDEVCKLNDASVEVILGLAVELGEKHGKTDEWWATRLAAREGRGVMDIVERLRACASGIGSFKSAKGDYGICDDAVDTITSLRARCASLEAERDGLKSKMLDLVLALEAVRDDVHLPPHVVGRVCAALAAPAQPVEAQTQERVRVLRKALEPFSRLQIPKKPQGNAGAYSIRHKDIEAARAALATASEVEG